MGRGNALHERLRERRLHRRLRSRHHALLFRDRASDVQRAGTMVGPATLRVCVRRRGLHRGMHPRQPPLSTDDRRSSVLQRHGRLADAVALSLPVHRRCVRRAVHAGEPALQSDGWHSAALQRRGAWQDRAACPAYQFCAGAGQCRDCNTDAECFSFSCDCVCTAGPAGSPAATCTVEPRTCGIATPPSCLLTPVCVEGACVLQ
jgi:hypothetical protein